MKKSSLKTAIQCVAFVCALILFSQVSMAGSLEPNAPPASTMKTLSQVEPRIAITTLPFTISASGSYYLVSDLTASNGITVDVNNVTIDLCGFSLIGSTNSGNGIYMNGRNNVEVRNGTIRNFNIGINETSGSGRSHRVIGVRAVFNAGEGIQLTGRDHTVQSCTASNNGTLSSGGSVYGIYAGTRSTVTGNTANNNGTSTSATVYGILASDGSTIIGNISSNNGASATASTVYGIKTGDGCTVSGNTAFENGISAVSVYGLYVGQGCSAVGNTVSYNGASASSTVYGIYVNGNSLVDQNTAFGNNGTNMNNSVSCTYGTNHAP
jgi:hypothetical protein